MKMLCTSEFLKSLLCTCVYIYYTHIHTYIYTHIHSEVLCPPIFHHLSPTTLSPSPTFLRYPLPLMGKFIKKKKKDAQPYQNESKESKIERMLDWE